MIPYRPDIDGLRAIAVTSVVIYHVSESVLPGGFVGVDIFFVISGFLITSIIRTELAEGTFSLLAFYERRARRILPALFAMLAIVTAVSAIVLIPNDLESYGKLLTYAIFFSANIRLARENDYFADETSENPLLHVWSLAVEEQFYFIWPILLLALTRFAPRYILLIAVVLFVLSLMASEHQIDQYKKQAFFLLQYRAFELLIGALLAFWMSRQPGSRLMSEALAVTGMVLIVISLATFDEQTRFPGFNALLPCLGTALLIFSANSSKTFVARILSFRPVVAVGKVSYSWYLWHWPPLAFAKYVHNGPIDTVDTLVALGVGTIAAILSYRWVEKPFRTRVFTHMSALRTFRQAAVATVVLLVFAQTFRLSNGLELRLSAEAKNIVEQTKVPNQRELGCIDRIADKGSFRCAFGTASEPEILLWGDSHARHYLAAVATIATEKGLAGRAVIRSSCPAYMRTPRERTHTCDRWNEEIIREIETSRRLNTIILAGRWTVYARDPENSHDVEDFKGDHFLPALRQLLEWLTNRGLQVIILDQVPEFEQNIRDCKIKAISFGLDMSHCGRISRESHERYQKRTNGAFLDWERSLKNTTLFDPEMAFCTSEICRAFDASGTPLYYDDDHLNIAGARHLVPMLRDKIERVVAKNANLTVSSP